jgi:hypothetical protein
MDWKQRGGRQQALCDEATGFVFAGDCRGGDTADNTAVTVGQGKKTRDTRFRKTENRRKRRDFPSSVFPCRKRK